MRRRGDKNSNIANANVLPLRLQEHVMRRNCFSCGPRSGIFIGEKGLALKLLKHVIRNLCEACLSVFMGPNLGLALRLLKQASESQLLRGLLECLHGAKLGL